MTQERLNRNLTIVRAPGGFFDIHAEGLTDDEDDIMAVFLASFLQRDFTFDFVTRQSWDSVISEVRAEQEKDNA